jgi:hypothetical protein
MSRSGYDEGCDGTELAMYRGMVASAIRGKRGQALLRDIADAMDAMPVKELIDHELESSDGAHCAMGCAGVKRGVDMSGIDAEDPAQVAKAFDVAECLAREIAYENDEGAWMEETPAQRWRRMRAWVGSKLKADGMDAGRAGA